MVRRKPDSRCAEKLGLVFFTFCSATGMSRSLLLVAAIIDVQVGEEPEEPARGDAPLLRNRYGGIGEIARGGRGQAELDVWHGLGGHGSGVV